MHDLPGLPESIARMLAVTAPQQPHRVHTTDGGHLLVEVPLDRSSVDLGGVWRRFLDSRAETGFHPVLSTPAASATGPVLPEREPTRLLSRAEYEETVGQLVAGSWRHQAGLYNPELDEEPLEEFLADLDEERLALELRSDDAVAAEGTPRQADRAGRLLLVEASSPHELFVRFPGLAPRGFADGYEDGDREMTARHHQAVLSSWYDRFGAEPYYVDADSLELWVPRPPLSAAEAARVAIEQYAYDFDLVGDTQLAGDGQVRSTHWNFWWD
ncbi:DUF4253 domain-containing protein [Streptomyces venezuelae]|uniref:DUF4253 domain-containing protein n=1 Tax=Streptomyces venezuelae TaxID=54571 RepID=UPI0012390C49|nr:DUF4253 domain-containing protein [Streptomyces venezuelae]QES08461.1 DUF4253 domain-containing protein [Streptomyces venezuelae]